MQTMFIVICAQRVDIVDRHAAQVQGVGIAAEEHVHDVFAPEELCEEQTQPASESCLGERGPPRNHGEAIGRLAIVHAGVVGDERLLTSGDAEARQTQRKPWYRNADEGRKSSSCYPRRQNTLEGYGSEVRVSRRFSEFDTERQMPRKGPNKGFAELSSTALCSILSGECLDTHETL